MKKEFLILWLLCLLGTVCVLPFALALSKTTPTPSLYATTFFQASCLYALVVYAGLKLAHSNKWLIGSRPVERWKILNHSIAIGILLGVLIYGLDNYVFLSKPAPLTYIPLWKKMLAAVYGAINEEVLMRLFFLSLLVKITHKVFKRASSMLLTSVCILLSAVLFGVGHLPLLATVTIATPLIIARTILLNAIGGIVFGWLFWRKSLASAMMAHGATDVMLALLLVF